MTCGIGGEVMNHKTKVQTILRKAFNKSELTVDRFDLSKLQKDIIELLKQKEDSIFNLRLKRVI